jgi:hypothetical protein
MRLGCKRFINGKLKPNYFHDYYCADGCSIHEKGYEWAKTNSVNNISACANKSKPFEEGCYAYVKDSIVD